MKRFAWILMLLWACGTCYADNDQNELFKIEVIFFEYTHPLGLGSEIWPIHPALPEFEKSQSLKTENIHDHYALYTPLPYNALNLKKLDQALQDNNNYKLLFHVAWLQPLIYGEHQTIHLYSGPFNYRYANERDAIYSVLKYDPSVTWKIDGTLKLTKQHYIHVDSDFLFNVFASELPYSERYGLRKSFQNPSFFAFKLHEKRRMHPNELQYFDHPLLGMLIKVIPVS